MPAAAAFVGVTGNNNRAYTLGDRRAEVRPLYTPYKARVCMYKLTDTFVLILLMFQDQHQDVMPL